LQLVNERNRPVVHCGQALARAGAANPNGQLQNGHVQRPKASNPIDTYLFRYYVNFTLTRR
jgi:hypothetical protein